MLDTLMFADDIVLLSSSADGLRKHLETLETFCLQWHVEINPEKTKSFLELILTRRFSTKEQF